MIYAKRGRLIDEENNRYFELFDGEMINKDDSKVTNITFEKIDFNLSKYETKTTTYPKIQEATSKDLYRCLYYNYKKKIKEFKAEYLICEPQSIDNIKQEFFKRLYKPIYFPLLALLSSLLILRSKENKNYNRFKFYLSFIIFFIIFISEISLRYSTYNQIGFLFFILFSILLFLLVYTFLITKFKKKIKI